MVWLLMPYSDAHDGERQGPYGGFGRLASFHTDLGTVGRCDVRRRVYSRENGASHVRIRDCRAVILPMEKHFGWVDGGAIGGGRPAMA